MAFARNPRALPALRAAAPPPGLTSAGSSGAPRAPVSPRSPSRRSPTDASPERLSAEVPGGAAPLLGGLSQGLSHSAAAAPAFLPAALGGVPSPRTESGSKATTSGAAAPVPASPADAAAAAAAPVHSPLQRQAPPEEQRVEQPGVGGAPGGETSDAERRGGEAESGPQLPQGDRDEEEAEEEGGGPPAAAQGGGAASRRKKRGGSKRR